MEQSQTLLIKNMVCPRCIRTVEETLKNLGLRVEEVRLGEARVVAGPGGIPMAAVEEALRHNGFALLVDRDQQTVERVKVALIEYVNALDEVDAAPLMSGYLADRLGMSYQQLSKTFSQNEEVTVERYLILLKIERVKELLSYGELTLSEIAYRLKYSSVQHLSAQFRKIVGVSVSQYKGSGMQHRHPLDAIA